MAEVEDWFDAIQGAAEGEIDGRVEVGLAANWRLVGEVG